METSELRKKNDGALQKELQDLLRERFNLRMQHGNGTLAQTGQLKVVRRNIARVKTILKESQKSKGEIK